MDELAGKAHSTKLDGKAGSQDSDSKPASTSTPPTNVSQSVIHTYMNPAKITENQRLNIELNMFKMFICCALPWALMDSQFFVDFVLALAPNFNIPDRSAFFPKHLSQEVAAWTKKFQEFLEGKKHLTFSLDGWSTRAKDEIYTFHTTTPKRRSFFTDGHIFNGISVTGQALAEVIDHVSTNIQSDLFVNLRNVNDSCLRPTMPRNIVPLQAMVGQMFVLRRSRYTHSIPGFSIFMIPATI